MKSALWRSDYGLNRGMAIRLDTMLEELTLAKSHVEGWALKPHAGEGVAELVSGLVANVLEIEASLRAALHKCDEIADTLRERPHQLEK